MSAKFRILRVGTGAVAPVAGRPVRGVRIGHTLAVTTAGPAGQLPHLRALDGLRGLAVVGVVAFHAGYLDGGFLGVDLFFTLSGFLITSLLLTETESTGAVDLRRFWSRRARRLLPALLLLLAFVPLYERLWATPFEVAGLRGDALATLAYVANWRQIAEGTEYWAQFNGPSPLQHTWSLAIEEQFYLLFPFLVLLALRVGVGSGIGSRHRRVSSPAGSPGAGSSGGDGGRALPIEPADRRRAVENRLLLVVAVLGTVSVAWMVLGSLQADAALSRLYFSTPTRFASILVGVALAALARRAPRPEGRGRVLLQGAAVAALALLAFVWVRVAGTDLFVYRGGLVLCATATAVVIFAIIQPGTTALDRALSLPPLVWLGLVSYGLYLWHWPVFVVLTPARTGLDGVPLLVIRLAVTFAFVVPSYYLLENPVRRRRLVTRTQARVALPAAVAVVVLLVLLPAPAPPDALASLHPIAVPAALRRAHPAGERPRVLLVGDSVGASLAPALTAHPEVLGVEVRSLARPACGIWPEVTRIRWPDGTISADGEGCADLIASWPGEAHRFRPDVGIVMLGFPGQLEREIDGAWVPFCAPRARELFRDHLGVAVDALHGEVATVVLTTTAPKGEGSHAGDAAAVAAVDCVNDNYRQVAATRPWLHVVDLAAHVCPGYRCEAAVDGNVLRPDGLHYAGPSAAIVGSWVLEQALQVAQP